MTGGGDNTWIKTRKKAFIDDMNEKLKKAQATYIVDYQGLDVLSMEKIRDELRKIGAEFYVVKNRLLKLAAKDTESESISDQFIGPMRNGCGI